MRKLVVVCTVLSWRRSRGPDSAACCGGLGVRRCGNDQQGCDMADLKMDSFRRTKMIQLNHHDLSHKHAFTFVRACEQTVCTSCTLCVCILCTERKSGLADIISRVKIHLRDTTVDVTAVGSASTVLTSSSHFAYNSLGPRCRASDSVMNVRTPNRSVLPRFPLPSLLD